MARTATQPPSPAKLAYSPREAAALTPFGYHRLLAFINSGELRAKRGKNDDGEPVGKIVILHRDLEDFLENMPSA